MDLEKDLSDNCGQTSLVDRFKGLIEILEKNGTDLSELYEKFGNNENIIQRLQDIEDDASEDLTGVFKQAILDKNKRRAIRSIVNIVKEDWHTNRRIGLRRILYSEGNLLKNPLNYSFSDDDYKFVHDVLIGAFYEISRLTKESPGLFTEELKVFYNSDIARLILLYECLFENRIRNEKNINDAGFLSYSLPQIIKSFLTYYEDQCELARERIIEKYKQQKCITGIEAEVASEQTLLYHDITISISDNFEQLIEDMDELFRYVFYLKSDEDIDEKLSSEYVSPYQSVDYSKIDMYSLLSVHYKRLESDFRYSNWSITLRKTDKGEMYVFFPNDETAYKTHIAAGLREKYLFMMDANAERIFLLQNKMRSKAIGPANSNDDICDGKKTTIAREYELVAKRMDVSNVEGFHFEGDEYVGLLKLVEPVILATKERNKPFFFTCQFDNMNVDEYMDAYAFLYTFSQVYYYALEKKTEERLVPSIRLDYLYSEYSKVSKKNDKKAKLLIDCYIFDKNVAKNKRLGDLFTRPLVCIGPNTVLLSKSLVGQMNLDRNIEKLLEWNNVNLAPMGKELEQRIIDDLKNAKSIKVNTNHIEFLAYDGKNIEFDFLAVIDEYLILMEVKSLLRPYDEDELSKRRKTIKEGVDQVARRVKVVQKDWNTISNLVSISLPKQPYDESHIIKIVCTDVYNYTGLEIDGVVLTDESTFTKFFTDPYVSVVTEKNGGESLEVIRRQVLWKQKAKPTAEELISYLHYPCTMDYIMDCIRPEWKPIPFFSGYKQTVYKDLIVEENPMIKLAEKMKCSE